jgi:CRP/FNR family cyclic AMP-dependent transcriptional regulator
MPRASRAGSGRRSNRDERRVRLPAGAILFDSIRPSRGIQRLDSGRVRLLSGSKAVLEHLEPGDFFGETCLFGSGRTEQTALCLTPVNIAVFRRPEVLERIERDRSFASALLRSLARRIQRCHQTIDEFVTDPAERRLALMLLRLAPRRRRSEWTRLPFGFTNADLAKAIGTTRGRISYFLNRFERLGWLRRGKGHMAIHPALCEQFLTSAGAG